MGMLALILGIVGGLCGVMGIVTAVGVAPLLGRELDWMFWFGLSGVLLIGCIASVLSRSPYE